VTVSFFSESGPAIILASASPRRRELLGAFPISYRVVAADIDERSLPNERPADLVRRLAETKALTIAARCLPGGAGRTVAAGDDAALVLAADTEVAFNGSVLGKPTDQEQARSMLASLRDEPHVVLTGLAFARGDAVVWSSVVETAVWMRPYSDAEIAPYVASGRPLDKAGAYGIQDAEFHPVSRIDGCYTNVVGLPLCEVRRALLSVDPGRFGSLVDPKNVCEELRLVAGVRSVDHARCGSFG
jgi:MAF protein